MDSKQKNNQSINQSKGFKSDFVNSKQRTVNFSFSRCFVIMFQAINNP